MTSVDTDRAAVLSERIAVARSALEGNIQRLEDSCARMQITRQQIRAGRSRRELPYHSAYARLEARLETMPVIEQAKGILMAQTGCAAEQAFDMLRRASQRANVKIRDLACEIVRRAAVTPQNGDALGRTAPGQARRARTQSRPAPSRRTAAPSRLPGLPIR